MPNSICSFGKPVAVVCFGTPAALSVTRDCWHAKGRLTFLRCSGALPESQHMPLYEKLTPEIWHPPASCPDKYSSVHGLDQNQKAGTIPVSHLQAVPALKDTHPEVMSCWSLQQQKKTNKPKPTTNKQTNLKVLCKATACWEWDLICSSSSACVSSSLAADGWHFLRPKCCWNDPAPGQGPKPAHAGNPPLSFVHTWVR